MKLDTTKKRHYDIMAALRGPDVGDDRFADKCKTLFTARIRHWVGCTSFAGSIRSRGTDDACIQLVLDNAPAEMPDWWLHYRSHVCHALKALKALLKMSPKSLQDFSPGEAEQLIVAIEKINARFYTAEEEDELPF
jgi:hypothetical protein